MQVCQSCFLLEVQYCVYVHASSLTHLTYSVWQTFVVRCTPSLIDVIPITFQPKLQQLTMYGTEIHTLDTNSFLWYEDLRHVNLR